MADPITYANAGGPPDNWHELEVFDAATAAKVDSVLEVDAAAGWLIRHRYDESGQRVIEGEEWATERVEGRFEIRPRA